MKIGLTYNLKNEALKLEDSRPRTEDMYEEFDSEETIHALCGVFKDLGHECLKLGFGQLAIEKILKEKPDLVFNIAEGYYGRSRESQMPALLEMLEIPYSGPGPFAAALSLDKISAKKMALHSGVSTPRFVEIGLDGLEEMEGLSFPVMVKPAYEGSSIGIREDSRVENLSDLEKKLDWLNRNYPEQPILVESFVAGREFTVAVIGNKEPEILGIMEIIPKDTPLEEFIYSLEVKRDYLKRVSYSVDFTLEESVRQKLENAALRLFRVFGCRDISRFDFRIDDSGEPQFLEANTLPGLHPVSSDIVIMARLKGIEYSGLIERILGLALERHGL